MYESKLTEVILNVGFLLLGFNSKVNTGEIVEIM